MAKRKLTLADLDSLNMPSSTNTRGIADPAALQALAWNEDYDVDARRDAIAAAMLAQQVAQSAPTQTAAPSFEQLTTSLGDPRLAGSGDYGMAGGASPGAGPGTSQAGDSSSVSIGGLFGAATPGYEAGAPGAGFGIGRGGGDAAVTSPSAALADPSFGSAMTTANASMVSEPEGAVVGGPFGGRGGADREGFGTNVNDPALASPTFSEPDPAVSSVSMFGREGDTTAPASQAAQNAGRSALAEAAMGRSPDAISMTSNPTPGKGALGEGEEDALAEGATSTVGRGGIIGLPGSFGMPGAVVAPATPTGPIDLNEMDQAAMATNALVSTTPSFVSSMFDVGKNMVGKGWDAVTAPAMTQSTPTYAGRVTPGSYAPTTPTPSGRAPVSPAGIPMAPTTPTPAAPDVADPGGSSFGFGGFSESTPGGYAGGPGMTTGFGAGYSGSSDFGNTQGAQGFTTGGFSSGAAQGFSTGAAQAAADAAASAAAGFSGTGDFSGGAGIGGGGADPGGGDGGGGGGGLGGGTDGGGSPGGVG